MSSVLGTEVAALPADAPTALLISDLHVPADGGPSFAALQGAVAAATAARTPLFVLGDLFDSYVSRAQVRRGIYRDVAALFRSATAAGVAIAVLHGNRDFLLGREFERRSGARIVAGGLRGRIGGVDTLLLHGDELCQNDLPYQRAKRWLRQPVLTALARSLPAALALWLAARARRRSQKVIQSGDQDRFLPTSAAVAAAFATGARRLVFGHIHRFAHGAHAGGQYWVMPAFDATGVGLWLAGGAVEPVCFRPDGTTSPVAVPGPCPFAP